MIYKTESTTLPQNIKIEVLPNDQRNLILVKNCVEQEEYDGVKYVYDEVSVRLPDHADVDLKKAQANFDEWWNYGCEEHREPTIEERIDIIEDTLTALLEM